MPDLEPLKIPRTATLASSVEVKQSPVYQSLANFFPAAIIDTFIYASKTGVRKSKAFLVVLLVIKNKDVLNCALYQVKQNDHGKVPFQVKTKYDLAKLRLVNGVSEEDEETEFELAFEKGNNVMTPVTVKWTAESARAKKNFLVSLWKLINDHMPTTPQFLNINYNLLQDSLSLSKTLKQVGMSGSPTPEAKEYKYLTGEEEKDLGFVTEGIDWSVENAEDFMQKLMNELSGLTKANIHSIMAVETDVIRLFNIMDHALHELCRLEETMEGYEEQLNEDRARVETALQSYKKQQIRNENTVKLQNVVEDMLEQITLAETTQDILQNLPLKSAGQIARLTAAVQQIQEKREKCNNSPLIEMTCVRDQRDKMDMLLETFAGRVYEAMSEITSPTWNAAQSIRHSKLTPLLPVVNWLASYSVSQYEDLVGRYTVTAQQNYQKVLREFFDDKRSYVTRKSTEKIFSKFTSRKDISQKMLTSNAALHSRTSLASTSQSNTSLDSLQSSKSESEFTITQGNQFESSVRDALDYMEIAMSKEECFINSFFGETKGEKERRDMVEIVLARFTVELESFINSSCKYDMYFALPIYLSLLDRLDDTPEQSYIYTALRENLTIAHKLFNKMHKFQKAKILESQKKAGKGAAQSVTQFTQFLLYSESLRKNCKRTSLDMCYNQLADAAAEAIELFASDQSKAPAEVVIVENFHFIYNFLFRNKIDGLEKFRKLCHRKYEESLELYVKAYLGSPLDKITTFFDGVQLKLNSGVPCEEIGFDPEFSKQKLKALTAEYTVKEVRKGLESTMKKIEKHFTKEQNLFRVACLTMQAEFIKQVEGYESLMGMCYPDAGLRFSFTVPQIRAVFEGKSPKH